MATSYTTGRNFYGSETKNTASANLTIGDQRANNFYRKICIKRDWPFLERRRTISTLASTQAYPLPYDCDQVRAVAFTPVGQTKVYTLTESPSRKHWDDLNFTTYTSDIPTYYFVFNGQILIWPTLTSASSSIFVTQKTKAIDLSIADYTTGTITTTSTVAGVTTVTGSGTTWTSQMVGRYIRITLLDTVNTGDGQWYEIATVPSTTTMTLTRVYGGTAITTGTAVYTIGQMPLLPDAFHDTPWKFAAAKYWAKEDDVRSRELMAEVTQDLIDLNSTYSSDTTEMVLDDGGYQNQIINPNLYINL